MLPAEAVNMSVAWEDAAHEAIGTLLAQLGARSGVPLVSYNKTDGGQPFRLLRARRDPQGAKGAVLSKVGVHSAAAAPLRPPAVHISGSPAVDHSRGPP
jgi:hypothetical protein